MYFEILLAESLICMIQKIIAVCHEGKDKLGNHHISVFPIYHNANFGYTSCK